VCVGARGWSRWISSPSNEGGGGKRAVTRKLDAGEESAQGAQRKMDTPPPMGRAENSENPIARQTRKNTSGTAVRYGRCERAISHSGWRLSPVRRSGEKAVGPPTRALSVSVIVLLLSALLFLKRAKNQHQKHGILPPTRARQLYYYAAITYTKANSYSLCVHTHLFCISISFFFLCTSFSFPLFALYPPSYPFANATRTTRRLLPSRGEESSAGKSQQILQEERA
jgi:hypothetical protein